MVSDDNNETLDNDESDPDNHNLNIDEPYITVSNKAYAMTLTVKPDKKKT
ncbi:MAG: hypothetical protein PHT69_09175 [Bacteroidales bacterium]|nr:hypothetical protein [Bacteroidales bacterium]